MPQLHPEPVTLRSQSGQFVVRGLPMGASPVVNSSTSQLAYIRVDPALMAVSCERIKQALLAELQMKDQWVGTISVLLHPVQHYDEPIDVISVRYQNGWSYRIMMPDQVDRARLIKSVVQALLREIANRRAREHQAELPPWLVDGIAANLQSTSLSTLTLEPESWINKQRERNADPLAHARELLRNHAPLSLNELNWPSEEQLSGENGDVYQACAHAFVHELLHLKNGRSNMARMLTLLPGYLNWQTAFLRAYETQFQRLLDVDKWWTLSVVHLTSRDMMFTWTKEETLKQLEEMLAVSAQVRLNPNELPMSTQVKMQQILAEWPPSRQTSVLLRKINLLQHLRMRASQEVVGLVDSYRATLEIYLKARRDSGEGPLSRHPLSKDRVALSNALQKLDQLDAERETLSQSTNTAPVVQFSNAPKPALPGAGKR